MNYLIMVVVIGFLIFVHEGGHLIAGKLIKIPIERFSLGFGPKIVGIKRGETEYCLSLIPIGGYVMPKVENEDEFFQFSIGSRIVFSVGGPIANIILAVILFAVLNLVIGGPSIANLIVNPFTQSLEIGVEILKSIPMIFSNQGQFSGIVGIVSQGGEAIETNFVIVIYLGILLSLNLAILNLLPIPPLDGGKIFLYILEKIHPVLMKLHIPLSIAGWVFFIGLMLYTTVLDILKIFT